MQKKIKVKVLKSESNCCTSEELTLNDNQVISLLPSASDDEKEILYMSDPFIDSHAHVYDGATDLDICADRIGYQTGVHLIVDAGSSGAINYPCFKHYVIPASRTPIKVFLNISRIGIVTKQPYYDERVIDLDAAIRCIKEDDTHTILGIKVLSSGIIVEHAGIKPLKAAVEAAEKANVRIMAHLVEGPPSNEDTIPLMRQGDIITHCFHGKPNVAANKKASRGKPLNPEYYSLDNVMWHPDGSPTKVIEDALTRGVCFDVGHGAGSFDQYVAGAVIRLGFRDFSISTDAHIRSLDSVVHSLPHVMSKFMALGMSLQEVIRSVTSIPAKQLGIKNWCGNLLQNATLFRVRPVNQQDTPFIDANHISIPVNMVIEPVAIILNGEFQTLNREYFKKAYPFGC